MKKLQRSITTLFALLLIIAVFSVLSPRYFQYDNLIDIINQGVVNGFLACGITVAIITGGIDLSVGSTMAVVIVTCAKLSASGVPVVPTVLVGLLVGAFIGSINGFLVTRMKLQPFIATLGTNQIFRGIAYVVSGGQPVLNIQGAYRNAFQFQIVRGVRMNMIYLLILAVVFAVILVKKRAGVYIYAIGSNEDAARMSGINVERYKMIAYMMCSIGAAMAGMVTLARLGTGEPTAGDGFETMAIAAAAVGGTSLAGGKGSILGTVLGAFTISALKIGLIVIGMDTFYQFIAIGLIIILATYLDTLQNLLLSLFQKKAK
ncbi:MAG: ABC transporter permease [Lachnospiraceae bacterium]|jgi:ribose transport system permease protein|nr:ABC transporter permease [Lachnospiraceae bacterium]MDE7059938.1 ABC transporter permease [Lachnospiraceae bacterium]